MNADAEAEKGKRLQGSTGADAEKGIGMKKSEDADAEKVVTSRVPASLIFAPLLLVAIFSHSIFVHGRLSPNTILRRDEI